jgi:uncharacterized membrane protein YgcG
MSSAWDDAVAVGAWAPKSLEEYESGACGKSCRHEESLGNGGDWLGDGSYVVPWECPHGSFLMAQQAPAGWLPAGASASHALELVWDSAATAATCVRWLEHRGCLSFGDITFLEDMRYYATETPEIRAQRKEAEARRDAADEAKVICSKVARKEEKRTNKGAMKFRVPRPCRYASLFEQRICANCSAKLPAGSNTCSASIIMVEEQERRHDGRMAGTGKMVARLASAGSTGVRVCGEKLAGCWNHDQHRSCIYVHPDEPQWAAACAGTLDVRADNRLIFCMATDPASQRLAGQAVQRGQPNRWAALAGSQQRGGGGGGGGGGQRQQGGGGAAGRPPPSFATASAVRPPSAAEVHARYYRELLGGGRDLR